MVSILVYDRIPVSKRSEIVVTPGNLSGAKLNPETGILEWKIDIQAGERVTLPFDYEVKYPKDTTINL